jgi:hypothetical protein
MVRNHAPKAAGSRSFGNAQEASTKASCAGSSAQLLASDLTERISKNTEGADGTL